MKTSLEELGLKLTRERVAEGGTSRIHQVQVVSPDSRFGLPGTLLALKEYKSGVLDSPGQFERIRQEAALASKVDHPNIVQSFGLLPTTDETALHLLEWVDGPTLQQWAASSKHTWDGLRGVAAGLLDGLAALHELGILHRDLKSENVLMSDGSPKITDLGIAEVLINDQATMHTQVKDFIGSIRFASPQFIRGEPFVPADDIYGVGTILFELFTGTQVYEDVVRKTLLSAEILSAPPKVGTLREGIPGPIRTLLEGTLSPDRARRPQISQLADAINTPENSVYIQSELDAQTRARRGYEVIAVEDDGDTAFVDLRGDSEFNGLDKVWRVVRRTRKVKVPSAGGEVELERWVADVHTKHVHGGVAQCIRVVRRWHADNSSNSRFDRFGLWGSTGHWLYDEPKPGKMQRGDLLVES